MTLQHDGIDVDDLWQAIEVCYEKNWTDGLPVVPPTEQLVARMLAAGPFAEDEESSPWEPLSVARGFEPGRSTVTVFAAESGHNVLAHGTASPERLLALFADAMAGLGSLSPGRSVIVLAPEHADHLKRAQ